jgi:hypothetical protein
MLSAWLALFEPQSMERALVRKFLAKGGAIASHSSRAHSRRASTNAWRSAQAEPNYYMRTLAFTLMSIVLASLPLSAIPQGDDSASPGWARSSWRLNRMAGKLVAHTDGNVIDLASGRIEEGMHIVVQGDRIVSVSREGPPEEAEIIDIRGKWVLPGLVDLHAHVIPKGDLYPDAPTPKEALAQLLKYGVTTIRCLPLVSEEAHLWSSKINTQRLVGPTMLIASPSFERVPQRSGIGFGTPDRARVWVLSSIRILGMQGVLGVMRADALAEFLILKENPLRDIKHLKSLEWVIHQGRSIKPN